jgi:hypothetical protein
MPSTDTGPNKRSRVAVHLRRIELRNGENHDPAGNPTTERKPFDLDSRIIVDHPGFGYRRPATFQIAAN